MKKNDDKRNIIRALALLSQLGLSMAACVFAGVMAGKLLDRWLGTSPWLLIVCSIIGAAASFKVMYDMAIREWL